MSSEKRGLMGVLVLSLALAGCGFERGEPLPVVDDPGDGGTPPGDGGETPGAVSFATVVHPMLIGNCQGCHGPSHGSALKLSGTAGTDYTVAKGLVDTSNAAGSRLYTKAIGKSHAPVLTAGSPEANNLLNWIKGGAQP